MCVEIPLSGMYGIGKVTMVDDDIAQLIGKKKIRADPAGYASIYSNGKQVMLHRFIMRPAAGMIVDHINRNRFDNRRENLRVCTQLENLMNRGPNTGKKYKGVGFRKGSYRATICHNEKDINVGTFATEREAVIAYNTKARELFGQYAFLNEVPPVPDV